MSLNAPSKVPMHETVLEELCNIDDEDERLRISTSAYNLYQRYTMIMILDFIIVIGNNVSCSFRDCKHFQLP